MDALTPDASIPSEADRATAGALLDDIRVLDQSIVREMPFVTFSQTFVLSSFLSESTYTGTRPICSGGACIDYPSHRRCGAPGHLRVKVDASVTIDRDGPLSLFETGALLYGPASRMTAL